MYADFHGHAEVYKLLKEHKNKKAAPVEAATRLQRHFEDWPCPAEEELAAGSGGPPASSPLAVLRASQPFACFLAMIALYGGAWFTVITHFNSSAREAGTSPDEAALLVSAQGIFNVAGRLLMGFLSDRLSALGVPKIALLQCNVLLTGAATLALAVPALQAFFTDLAEDFPPMDGPLSEDQISAEVGPLWNVSRRFPVSQGTKIRAIDDFSESFVNASFGSHEKISLGGISPGNLKD
jgi:hypothetical protein